jgi:predicted Ser/Thr protein kinase
MRKGGISRAEAISAADEFIKLVGETPGKSKEQMLEELMKRGYSRTTAEKMLRQRKRK